MNNTSDSLQLPAMSAEKFGDWMLQHTQPKFRARQVLDWRNKGVTNPDEMRNLPKALRELLRTGLQCEPLQPVHRQCSTDGTRKYLFELSREKVAGKQVEAVFIPEAERGTVCVSSQVGCVLDCPFCFTGTQGFEANLTAGEIVAQILAIKHDLRSEPLPRGLHSDVTHVVYMGMGEPLANEQGVHESLGLLMAEDGLHLSRRRITVSTSGLVPQIRRLGAEQPVNLAISLHAAIDALRDELVPINRKYSLAELRTCLDAYPLPAQRHITLEYVMLAGVNDRPEDLEALAGFVNRAREQVNLIQFNPYPGSPYTGTDRENMNKFAQGLISKGVRATVRRSRGQDIMAACGQLKAAGSTP